jgi:hypothetical protein
MERREEQIAEATAIAISAGVLSQCEYHPEMVWDNFGDPQDTYRLGNARFTAGKLATHFETRRDLTDAIKAAIEESGMRCTLCDKLLAD